MHFTLNALHFISAYYAILQFITLQLHCEAKSEQVVVPAMIWEAKAPIWAQAQQTDDSRKSD